MQRVSIGLLIGVLVVITLGAVACSGGSSSQDAAAEAEWAWLTETKQSLDSKRQELAKLRMQAAEAADELGTVEEMTAAVEEQGGTGEDQEAVGEIGEEIVDLDAKLETLEEEVAAETDEFTQRLVQFLNADPMIEGEPPTERQIDALRMKSSEDMILAQEWIEKGGDYKRAIEIYETALMFDPDNPELAAALEEAEANRWMAEERFATVTKGMTQAEVRSLLGQANLHNIRKYEDKGVEAWFYPTAEDGSAAAVWFQPDKSGKLTVYQVKFEAVDPKQLAEEEG
ncbi:MAG: hypothetical protein P8Y44_12650 [Acidobacteriota bacterium]